MQIPILSGTLTDASGDFRTTYPINMVPVPKDHGISKGYLRPAEGIVSFADSTGKSRGGMLWNGEAYYVCGARLLRVKEDGTTVDLGLIEGTDDVSFCFSFDRMGLCGGGKLYYLVGDILTQVTDDDLGTVNDVVWVDGYFVTTDGEFLISTELADPTSVNPLKYGSSEIDPDPVLRLLVNRNEIYAINRHTVEVFTNVGGEFFPFARINGAHMQKGAVGRKAACVYSDAIAFVGSGRNEPPAVYMGENAQTAAMPTQNPQLLQDAQRAGVRVMTTDAVPPKSFVGRFAQASGEKIPYAGTGGPRVAQHAERVEAVKRVAQDIGGDLSQYPDDVLATSLRSKRAADVRKYVDLKDGVFQKLDNAGPMPTQNVTNQIDGEIQRLTDLGSENFNGLVGKLQDLKTAIHGKNIRQVETLRKAFGETLGTDDFAAVKSEADKVSKATYRALNKDIEGFIKTTATDRDVVKWKVANNRLAGMIGELDSSAFKTALNKGDITPEAVRKLLFSKNKSDVQLLYKTLTPEGKAAARTSIIKDAIDSAGGLETLSPQKFANQLSKRSDQVGVFFTDAQKNQADGLLRVIKATQRASEASAAPPTGVQLAIPVGAAWLGSVFGDAGAAVASGATIGGLARAYESAPVRNMLIKLAQTAPGSKIEGDLIRRVLPVMQQISESNKDEK